MIPIEKKQLQSIGIYQSEAPEWKKYLQQLIEYDIHGNKIKSIVYEEDGFVSEEIESEYDNNKNLIREKFHFPEDEVTELIAYEYNNMGILIRSIKKYGESEEDITHYSYNSDHKLIEKKTIGADGSMEQEEIRNYQNHLLVSLLRRDAEGAILERSDFLHNANGELQEETRYNPESEKEIKIIYDFIVPGKEPNTTTYNDLGHIIERTRLTFDEKARLTMEVHESRDEGIKKFTSHFTYDDKDRLIESKLLDKSDKLIRKITYRHNDLNLLAEETHFNGIGNNQEVKSHSTTTEYKFYELNN